MKRAVFIFTMLLLFSVPVSAQDSVHTQDLNYLAVYRHHNRTTGEHLFTSDKYESLMLDSTPGWKFEGVAWAYSVYGEPVYRMFNPNISDHLYTMDTNEVNTLRSIGWRLELDGFPIYRSMGPVPIYRLYNPRSGRHHLTTDSNEYNVLAKQGWRKEGISSYATSLGDPY